MPFSKVFLQGKSRIRNRRRQYHSMNACIYPTDIGQSISHLKKTASTIYKNSFFKSMIFTNEETEFPTNIMIHRKQF